MTNQRLLAVKVGEAVESLATGSDMQAVFVITVKHSKRYDQGNFIQACKALLDSLQPDVIVNDNLDHCRDFYFQESARKWGWEGTIVIVCDVEKEGEVIAPPFIFDY